MRGGNTNTRNTEPETTTFPTSVPENGVQVDLQNPIRFVFSDVDGTLVHYPEDMDHDNDNHNDNHNGNEKQSEEGNAVLHLPPSSTGMRGVISSKTLKLCQLLRREHNVKLVLVSGMRTSTLIKRLPYLPRADAYASEAGGRIFYPKSIDGGDGTGVVRPVSFDGATEEDLQPYTLEEDKSWRSKLSREDAAGTDGYVGDAMAIFLGKKKQNGEEDARLIPIDERSGGALWKFAQELQRRGFVIDYKGYSSCFRVNRKHQEEDKITNQEFEALKTMDVSSLGLATSVNLGCVDFYPVSCGKKNCCAYIANHLGARTSTRTNTNTNASRNTNTSRTTPVKSDSNNHEDAILEHCICLCDDDNDLEMAAACGKVFLPSVTSESMRKAAEASPDKMFIMEDKEGGIVETRATEHAVLGVLEEFSQR
eukprot:CAMPEP_0197236712 /NCGR_PEP_ID=MMETSP1429-20130617/3738_1 /TAXON_ID=49237 /ORGANISM="Chaetoceros  sp., Strain UNC1202" /LENGTH=422 /DNA_ID=CAMNT_0042695561 /DNA_START=211 /DNA_END=1479 /DNA_ORIENTATION=+